MKVYFDTNVYRFISQRNEVNGVRKLLRTHGLDLVASSENLFETYAISDYFLRTHEAKILTSLATEYEPFPVSYRMAREVRLTLRKHRPHLVRKITFEREIRQFLKRHNERWRDALHGILPGPKAFRVYAQDNERGIAQSRRVQKDLRAARLNESQLSPVRLGEYILFVDGDLADPGVYWRIESLEAYYAAIIQRHPASRDLADWLLPFLKISQLTPKELVPFWLSDVQDDEVPVNRLAGLVTYFQLGTRVTHGNSFDQLHALQTLEVDLFVTADVAFFSVLTAACRAWGSVRARVALINRDQPSAIEQLELALR